MKSNFFKRFGPSILSVYLLVTGLTWSNKCISQQISATPQITNIDQQFRSATYTDKTGNNLPYRFFEPAGKAGVSKYPVILYLHGENESGTDNKAQLTKTECATIWVQPDHLSKNPTYVLAPQAPAGSDWTKEPAYSDVLGLLHQFIQTHPDADPNRIYIVGFSKGATGVWNMILKNPTLFAAALPISGNADVWLGNTQAFAALKNFPVLAVHSMDDPVSAVSGSNNALAALKLAGNRTIGFNTSIWGMGAVVPPHNAWYPAFHNYEVIYNWMFDQSLTRTNHGAIDPTTLFTKRDLGNGIIQVWDYALGTVYVLERRDKTIIIDAAQSNGSIYQFIRDSVLVNKNADLELFITHNHFDHIGGVPSFVGATQLKSVYVHPADSDPVKKLLGPDSSKITFIHDGDKIALDGKNIEVIGVPAHTFGSCSFLYENNLFSGDCIGSGDVWLSFAVPSIEDYVPLVQHVLDKIGNNNVNVFTGHTGEYRAPMSQLYIQQMLACAQGLSEGSIVGIPYRRTIGNLSNLGFTAGVGRANIVYNLNNIHIIKGALRSLNISAGELTPRFAPYISYYSAVADAGTDSTSILPAVLAEKYENLSINGHAIASGAKYSALLNKGDNLFSIVVTTSDKTSKTYTLVITKK